jgi:hypothetical protein
MELVWMMSRRKATAGLIVLIIFLVLSPTRVEPRPKEYDSSEASRVYGALLSSRHFTYRADVGEYVIEAETMDSKFYGYYLGEGLHHCFPDQGDLDLSDCQALRDLEREAQIPRAIPRQLELKIPYELVEREKLQAQTNKNGVLWVGFRKRYPDSSGILSLSPVGFKERKDRALVYVSFVCDDLCGGADF